MKEFNLRYYPPFLLAIMFCLIIAVNFLIKKTLAIISGQPFETRSEVITLLLSGGLVTSILRTLNRFAMWGWLLKLMGLCDLRGNYSGELISSYYKDDNPGNDQVRKYLVLHISQNLNGLQITGKVFNNQDDAGPSSTFVSTQCEIRKVEDGSFLLTYYYTNKPDLLTPERQKHKLNMHDGFASLTFQPGTRQLDGVYFNHGRQSHGRIFLKFNS